MTKKKTKSDDEEDDGINLKENENNNKILFSISLTHSFSLFRKTL